MTATASRPRPTTQQRFAARARSARLRPWKVVAAAVAAVLVVAGLVWLVWFSTVLAAREVRVEVAAVAGPDGDRVTLPAAVLDDVTGRAAVPPRTPLARVDTDAVAASVIGQPLLADVTVARSYPSTLVVRVTPRVPVLAVRNPQGEVQLVDQFGSAYTSVASVPRGVPTVQSTQRPPTAAALQAGIAVVQALPVDVAADVSSVTVSGANLVTFKVEVGEPGQESSVTVTWGGGDKSALKAEVLSILLRQSGIRTIDVSAPLTPTTT